MPPRPDYPAIDITSATAFFAAGGTYAWFDGFEGLSCPSSINTAALLVDWYDNILTYIEQGIARYRMWLWLEAQGGI